MSEFILTRANPYLLQAARSARASYLWLEKFRVQLAWIGSGALVLGVLALIGYLFSAPDTAPALVGAWLIDISTSLVAALFSLVFIAAALMFIAIGAGFPPSKWNLSKRLAKVREYIAG